MRDFWEDVKVQISFIGSCLELNLDSSFLKYCTCTWLEWKFRKGQGGLIILEFGGHVGGGAFWNFPRQGD